MIGNSTASKNNVIFDQMLPTFSVDLKTYYRPTLWLFWVDIFDRELFARAQYNYTTLNPAVVNTPHPPIHLIHLVTDSVCTHNTSHTFVMETKLNRQKNMKAKSNPQRILDQHAMFLFDLAAVNED